MIFSKKLRANLLLLLVAAIWGSAFVAQSVGGSVGTFTFNAARNLLAAFALLVCIPLFNLGMPASGRAERLRLLVAGVSCGVLLFAASAFQQAGINSTTAGKAGFITALYIVIVPLLGVFFRRKASVLIWLSVFLAAFGMYLLCISGGLTIGRGDLLVLCCAFLFALHILAIDHFVSSADAVRMSCIQFLTAGILNLIPMLIFERPSLSSVTDCWIPIVYAGILSSAVAYTLQIVAQKNTEPVIASLLMSLESVFAALSGWLLLNESLSRRELFGCVLIFLAVIFAQLPTRETRRNVKSET